MNSLTTYINNLNKIHYDEYGRPNGILLINKPEGVLSHDIVYKVRNALQTKKVGHAGALDAFSSGLLLILVGKCTKFSNELINKDKKYIAKIILGIKTTTQDSEGSITEIKEGIDIKKEEIEKAINSFKGGYEQFVSIYSSVKVNGVKLRKALRKPNYTYSVRMEGGEKFIDLINQNTKEKTSISVPKRFVDIFDIKINSIGKIDNVLNTGKTFSYMDVFVHCSKGTYIRQLGEDIGGKLNIPTFLLNLDRTGLSTFNKEDSIGIEDLNSLEEF